MLMLQVSLKPKTIMQNFKNQEKLSMMLRLITLIILVFVAVGAIGFRLITTHAAGCAHPYTVQWGDTLSAIAYRNGTTWQALAQTNGIENANLIFVGQQICLAKAATSPGAGAGQPVSTGSVAQIINSVFGQYAGQAQQVAMCESSLNPNATNPIYVGNSHAAGVFQILYPSTWSSTSEATASPYNAVANIQAAHEIFVRDGYSWREWVCQP
jgi:LysM repeat protein